MSRKLRDGQPLIHIKTGARYVVEAMEDPKGSPTRPRYVLRLVYRWSLFSQPVFLTSLSEDFILENFTSTKLK